MYEARAARQLTTRPDTRLTRTGGGSCRVSHRSLTQTGLLSLRGNGVTGVCLSHVQIMTRDFLNAGILAVILSLAAAAGTSSRGSAAAVDASKSKWRRDECRGGGKHGGSFAELDQQSKRPWNAAAFGGSGSSRAWDRQVGFLEEALRFLAGVLSEIRKRDS